METAPPVDLRRELERRLVLKAWKDPEFKKAVLENPKGMLEGLFGQPLPPDFNVYVHEEDANHLHLFVPPQPKAVAELSDDELERVAGGTEFFIVAGIIAGVAAFGTAVGSGAGVTKTVGGW